MVEKSQLPWEDLRCLNITDIFFGNRLCFKLYFSLLGLPKGNYQAMYTLLGRDELSMIRGVLIGLGGTNAISVSMPQPFSTLAFFASLRAKHDKAEALTLNWLDQIFAGACPSQKYDD